MVPLICVSGIVQGDAGSGQSGQEENKASRHCLSPVWRVVLNMVAGTTGTAFRPAAAHEQDLHDDLLPVSVPGLDWLYYRT